MKIKEFVNFLKQYETEVNRTMKISTVLLMIQISIRNLKNNKNKKLKPFEK